MKKIKQNGIEWTIVLGLLLASGTIALALGHSEIAIPIFTAALGKEAFERSFKFESGDSEKK